MKFHFAVDPCLHHAWFAWYPVLVINRATGLKYYAWFEKVQRCLVSTQGVAAWTYSPIP